MRHALIFMLAFFCVGCAFPKRGATLADRRNEVTKMHDDALEDCTRGIRSPRRDLHDHAQRASPVGHGEPHALLPRQLSELLVPEAARLVETAHIE